MPRSCCKNKFPTIPDDVPVFTIIGYDLLAVKTIEKWLELAKKEKVNQFKVDVATAHLEDIKRFQEKYPERCKIPD